MNMVYKLATENGLSLFGSFRRTITIIIIIITNVFISPVKIPNKRYREWSIQIMKNLKPHKTLDIDIVNLLSCIETLFY